MQRIGIQERQRLLLLILTQVLVNLIDLIGIGLLGLVGAITVAGIQSQSTSPAILTILSTIGLENKSFQMQVSILAIVATSLLVSRTFISLYLSRRTFLYFARKSIFFSQSILKDTFRKGFESSRSTSTQGFIYSTTSGCDVLMIGVFAQSTVLVSDIALLIFMGIGVCILQPATALVSIMIFGSAGAYMHLVLNKKSKFLGQSGAAQAVINGRKVQELLGSFREIYTANKSFEFITEIGKTRKASTDNQAEINYLPIVNKYFLETTLLVGALSVSAIEFVLNDAETAISGLAVFLAAGSRIAPALLRVQQNLLNIRNSLGGAGPTISKLLEVDNFDFRKPQNQKSLTALPPEVRFEAVSFTYQNSKDQVISNVTFKVGAGETFAISGPSGSGKTTLVDLMLGLVSPQQGFIEINGVNPRASIEDGLVTASYVPQEVQLLSASFMENIALGVPTSEVDLAKLSMAIENAQLGDVVKSLSEGVETKIGEEGVLLSGGQKQRVGIARALYSNAKLIILDEPTSALDGETEGFIATAIESLRGSATVVVIAHRLNTLKNVDKLLYIINGSIAAQGTFEEVRNKIPNFNYL
jgi:ABC-type multidrug transport system fused ATPase/permease subunit